MIKILKSIHWNPLYRGFEDSTYPPPPVRTCRNAKNENFEFCFDCGKHVFQWTEKNHLKSFWLEMFRISNFKLITWRMLSIWSLWVCHHISILSTSLNFLHSYLRRNQLLRYTPGKCMKSSGRLKSLNLVDLMVFSPNSWKEFAYELSGPLTDLLNCSFEEGVVPS